ncbi:hypothetical protein FQN49_005792 [Arthroderma sp. PD_2]|nr:hypothetical protein FQN49_005792 [Arthroderma sp. PD_2]
MSELQADFVDAAPVKLDLEQLLNPTGENERAEVVLPGDSTVYMLWDKLASLGYERPDALEVGGRIIRARTNEYCLYPPQVIEVVGGQPSEAGVCINENEPLIVFANRGAGEVTSTSIGDGLTERHGREKRDNIFLDYDGSGLRMEFQRTTRMPDDQKLHHLPASLGSFRLYNVSDYSDRLPEDIVKAGGVFLPMWQREALWINFTEKPGLKLKETALRIYVGKINAVTGKKMDDAAEASGDKDDPVQDYVVVPGQPWLDGICVSPGVVRQFVAMPLGSGYTVEGQKTGEEKFGGFQIEMIPSYTQGVKKYFREPLPSETVESICEGVGRLDELKTPLELGLKPGSNIRAFPPVVSYARHYAVRSIKELASKCGATYPQSHGRVATASCGPKSGLIRMGTRPTHHHHGLAREGECLSPPGSSRVTTLGVGTRVSRRRERASQMGISAGGKLVQDIYKDKNDHRIWNTDAARLINVHIFDPRTFESVTHIVPMPPPIGVEEYTKANLPYYVVEEQPDNRLAGGDFDNVLSVSAMDKKKGVVTEPSLDPSRPSMCKECETRLCDCVVRPCGHLFCNICIRKLEATCQSGSIEGSACPACNREVSHVAGFSAPMNLPGEEPLKAKVQVKVLKVDDGRVRFKSVQRTRV